MATKGKGFTGQMDEPEVQYTSVTKEDFNRLVKMIEAINLHLGITKEKPVEKKVEG